MNAFSIFPPPFFTDASFEITWVSSGWIVFETDPPKSTTIDERASCV